MIRKPGGGRIIGEACHFIDMASVLVDSSPVSVYCSGVRDTAAPLLNDNVRISLLFQDGSRANVTYISLGPKALRKEYIEVFGGGRAGGDYRQFPRSQVVLGRRRFRARQVASQDKEQRDMCWAWIGGMLNGNSAMDFNTVMAVSAAAVWAVESMTIGQPITIGPWLWGGDAIPAAAIAVA